MTACGTVTLAREIRIGAFRGASNISPVAKLLAWVNVSRGEKGDTLKALVSVGICHRLSLAIGLPHNEMALDEGWDGQKGMDRLVLIAWVQLLSRSPRKRN